MRFNKNIFLHNTCYTHLHYVNTMWQYNFIHLYTRSIDRTYHKLLHSVYYYIIMYLFLCIYNREYARKKLHNGIIKYN